MKTAGTLKIVMTAVCASTVLSGCAAWMKPQPQDTANREALVATVDGEALYVANEAPLPAMQEIADFRMNEYCQATGQKAVHVGSDTAHAPYDVLRYRCE